MQQQHSQKDHVQGQQLIEGVFIEAAEGEPEAALIEVVEVNEEDKGLEEEPRAKEQGVSIDKLD